MPNSRSPTESVRPLTSSIHSRTKKFGRSTEGRPVVSSPSLTARTSGTGSAPGSRSHVSPVASVEKNQAGADSNLATLHVAMGRITNYTGITNFMGGRFLADPDALEPVMRDIAARGIMFLDDGTSAQSLTDKFAKTLGIPFAASDMVLDGTQERGYILSRLDDLERTARRNGVAIGVASAFEVSVDAIAAWANEAKARGIEIVSASAAADDPEK